jgi:GH15 family glucan-1,4-alpha-glucosidase
MSRTTFNTRKRLPDGLQRIKMEENKSTRKRIDLSLVFWGSVLATLMGALTLEIARQLCRVVRQPRLASRAISTAGQDADTLEDQAVLIAVKNLRAGIEKRRLANGQEKLVLSAGWRNFREPWARDFAFASFGLLVLRESEVTRETLEAFLAHQTPTGQFPIKLHSTGVVDRYLYSLLGREQPIDAYLRPRYISGHKTLSLDGNALLVIAGLNYAQSAGDDGFARCHWEAFKRAMLWLEEYALEEDGLLHQGAFADWADSIARQGRILYTNVTYWKALEAMAGAATIYGYADDQIYFGSRSRQLKNSINDHFWRPDLGYFVIHRSLDNLSSAGNLLAIAWGLATPEQAHAILDTMCAFDMANPIPTRVVHQPYPSRLIALENRLTGLSYYHTRAAWLWLGAWHVIALVRVGRAEEAQALARRMAKVIVRDGEVHEVYAPDGQYVSSFWYTSEAPLTWSAGMVVYAFDILREHLGSTDRFQEGEYAHHDFHQRLQAYDQRGGPID